MPSLVGDAPTFRLALRCFLLRREAPFDCTLRRLGGSSLPRRRRHGSVENLDQSFLTQLAVTPLTAGRLARHGDRLGKGRRQSFALDRPACDVVSSHAKCRPRRDLVDVLATRSPGMRERPLKSGRRNDETAGGDDVGLWSHDAIITRGRCQERSMSRQVDVTSRQKGVLSLVPWGGR